MTECQVDQLSEALKYAFMANSLFVCVMVICVFFFGMFMGAASVKNHYKRKHPNGICNCYEIEEAD